MVKLILTGTVNENSTGRIDVNLEDASRMTLTQHLSDFQGKMVKVTVEVVGE